MFAPIAQQIEQFRSKEEVRGAIPLRGAKAITVRNTDRKLTKGPPALLAQGAL